MKDSEHDDSMGLGAEEHGVGETAHLHAPDFFVLDGKAFRLSCRKLDGAVDLRHERYAPSPGRRSSYHSAAASNSARAARRKTTFKVISSGVR